MTTEEYNICVDTHADGVYRFILHSTRDKEFSQDIVQDSFEKMWMNLDNINGEKSKSYLYTTAYHTMLEKLRRQKKQGNWNEVSESEYSHSSGHYQGLKEIIKNALDRLPEIQKSVIMLRDYEGYSYQEIGEITSLSESQVKVYIYRARLAMKEFIGKLENVI